MGKHQSGDPKVPQEGSLLLFAFGLKRACRDQSPSVPSKNFFLSNHSSVLIEGLLYTRPSITGAGSNCQNTVLGNVLKTPAAETHTTKFRTGATTTPRADHIHNRRHIPHIIRFSFVSSSFILSLFFNVAHHTFSNVLYDVVDTLVYVVHTDGFPSPKSRILSEHWLPPHLLPWLYMPSKIRQFLLIVINLSLSKPLTTTPHLVLPSVFLLPSQTLRTAVQFSVLFPFSTVIFLCPSAPTGLPPDCVHENCATFSEYAKFPFCIFHTCVGRDEHMRFS